MTQIDNNHTQSILLVEDSEDDFEATSRAFRKTNLFNPIVWVSSGEEALRYLHREGEYAGPNSPELPGLILLDLNMPGMDGRRVLHNIKASPDLKSIPVVILTTSSDERDIRNCYADGASTYIPKPVSFNGLIEAIKSLKEYWFEIAILPKNEASDGAN